MKYYDELFENGIKSLHMIQNSFVEFKCVGYKWPKIFICRNKNVKDFENITLIIQVDFFNIQYIIYKNYCFIHEHPINIFIF